MTRKAELLALADRVEALTGPDREVDAEIALLIGVVREREGNCLYGHRDYSVMVLERDYYDHAGGPPELPAYTASLDAAMTLVPEGWGPMLEPGLLGVWHSRMAKVSRYITSLTNHSGVCNTPSLALAAATLRALASQEPNT